MFETNSEYREFFPLARSILEKSDRGNLVRLLEQPKMKNLFLHNVDHPMGYQDGPSGVSYLRLKKRTSGLTDKDRKKLYEISERMVREVENNSNELSEIEKANALLGANQLVQNASWKGYRPNSRDKTRENLIERISKTYIENPENIGRIKEWDAQIAENQGFYHISKGMDMKTTMAWMFGIIPAMLGEMWLFGKESMESFYMPLFVGGALSMYANNFLLLPLQDFFGDKKSPNTSSKMITGRQYKFLRHPLYASRMLGYILFGVASFPFGTYSCAKGLYHNAKGCEKQDERMRILHGDEAVEYQKNTPVMIPGTKTLMKGLRKILPEKFCNKLDTPVSHYLEKIPGIKDENYYTDDWVTYPGYNKGSPTCYVGTDLEKKAHNTNPLKDMAEVFLGAGKLMTYDLGKWAYKKVSKKLNQRKRRFAWENSQTKLGLEKTITQ